MEEIQLFFKGVGKINKSSEDTLSLDIRSIQELYSVILPHFDKYPLISQKKSDFELFKRVINIIHCKEHLTSKGIQEIVSVKASMNRGLSNELKEAFSNTKISSRPLTVNQQIPSPYWISGFTSGEGNFFIALDRSGSETKFSSLRLNISQHIRDEALMRSLVYYLGCGRYSAQKNRPICYYECSKFSDLNDKIIPFFIKYPIVGVKLLEFADWCKAAEIFKAKGHLTEQGLNQIKKIKAGMNTGR